MYNCIYFTNTLLFCFSSRRPALHIHASTPLLSTNPLRLSAPPPFSVLSVAFWLMMRLSWAGAGFGLELDLGWP